MHRLLLLQHPFISYYYYFFFFSFRCILQYLLPIILCVVRTSAAAAVTKLFCSAIISVLYSRLQVHRTTKTSRQIKEDDRLHFGRQNKKKKTKQNKTVHAVRYEISRTREYNNCFTLLHNADVGSTATFSGGQSIYVYI